MWRKNPEKETKKFKKSRKWKDEKKNKKKVKKKKSEKWRRWRRRIQLKVKEKIGKRSSGRRRERIKRIIKTRKNKGILNYNLAERRKEEGWKKTLGKTERRNKNKKNQLEQCEEKKNEMKTEANEEERKWKRKQRDKEGQL